MIFEILMAGSFVIFGLFAGVMAGLFGIGGGTLLIPFLLTVFSRLDFNHQLDMHVAVATSLALILPTAIASSISHLKNNHLDTLMAKRWIPGVCFGVGLGVLCLHLFSAIFLKLIFSIYLLFCIGYNLINSQIHYNEKDLIPWQYLALPSIAIGFLSTLLGVGGGTFTTPVLKFFHYPLRCALGLSAFTGLFVGGIGAFFITISSLHCINLPPFSFGFVNWLVFLLIAPTAAIGSSIGVGLAEKMEEAVINNLYTLLLILILALMIYHIFQ